MPYIATGIDVGPLAVSVASSPRLAWAMCTVARSGSTWLSQLIASTGLLGIPDEYLLEWPQRARTLGYSDSPTFEEYLTGLLWHCSTPNGVFALKGSHEELLPFFDFFPHAPCVWLLRLDKIAQAVSWHRAHDGGMWTSPAPEAENAHFVPSVERVLYFYDEIRRREALWREFFARHPVPPLVLTYEEVCASPLQAVRSIAAYLGIDPRTVRQVSSSLTITRDHMSAELAEQARRALHERDRARGTAPRMTEGRDGEVGGGVHCTEPACS